MTIDQFGDTFFFFIGPAGEEVPVYQTTVNNNYIYAVTSSYGIRRADVNNPNLVDFSQWSVFDAGYWSGIETFQNQLIVSNSNATVYRHNGAAFNPLINVGQAIVDLEAKDNRLIITSNNHVYVYNENFTELAHVTPDSGGAGQVFSCATAIGNAVFIGTTDKGLYTTTTTNASASEYNTPKRTLSQ